MKHKILIDKISQLVTVRAPIQDISEAEFASLVENLRPILESYPTSYGFRSTFEVLTAIAFLYFQQQKVDYQVLEVGLGGRLDATNVVRPLVSVITSISFDHTDVLGNTLTQIAGEKAGIIKPGVPVVTSPQTAEATNVLRQVAQEKGAKLIEVGKEITWQGLEANLKGQGFRVKGEKGEYDLFIPLLGDFQLENAATAVAALEQLSEPRITPQSIALGFSRVSWPGRLQVLRERPLLVVDGAHNDYSMARLREAVKKYFTFNRLFLIFGLSIDKEAAGMTKELAPLQPEVILATSNHPRAMPATSMVRSWQEQGIEPSVCPDVPQALIQAQAQAGDGDLILATGSLFIVAEVIEYVRSQKQEGKP